MRFMSFYFPFLLLSLYIIMVREMKVFENNKVPDYKIFDDKKDFTYIFQKHYSFNPKISSPMILIDI